MSFAGTIRVLENTGTGRQKEHFVSVTVQDGALALLARARSIPISEFRSDAGAALTAAATAGTLNISVSSNVIVAQGEIADNETETSIGYVQISLPFDYEPGSDITVAFVTNLVKTGAATDDGSSLDLSAFKQAAGAVGSDLVTTAAQTYTAVDTWETKSFTIDATGLVAGDVLNLKITAVAIDNEAGGGTLRINLQPPVLTVDVQASA